VRIGREFWVLVHVLLRPEQSVGTTKELDGIRRKVHDAVKGIETGMVTDVVFTADKESI
jgi:predicted Co/Zn/Cd cation transporter (cation efflux family)